MRDSIWLAANGIMDRARAEWSFTVWRVGCPRLARGTFTFAATHKASALSPIPPFPGGEAAGERSGVGAVLCSNYRNHPPGKPGAFVKCQNEY